jgi:hypothetical protein
MGGSGGTFGRESPQSLRDRVRRAEERARDAASETEVARTLGELLGDYNSRDTQLVRERLTDLKDALEGTIEGTVDQIFGGSVAKHTYVDGLSDIDSLFLINDTDLEDKTPQAALTHGKEYSGWGPRRRNGRKGADGCHGRIPRRHDDPIATRDQG